jgi:hypothetical protein
MDPEVIVTAKATRFSHEDQFITRVVGAVGNRED